MAGAAAGALLFAVPVDATATAGYAVLDGRPVLVVPTADSSVGAVRPGERVQLRSAGLMHSPVVATAVVDGPPGAPARVPSAVFGAVKGIAGHTDVVRCRLRDVHGHVRPDGGRATVRTGTTTLAGRLADLYLLPPLRVLTALG
ncbi:hypothetical protein T261_6875 [Streptomyces lydicus]|nr:hypothetical protein T261_6875 [Streptomyces lydicus]